MPVPLISCPVCWAAVPADDKQRHVDWHTATGTHLSAASYARHADTDDAQTQRFPPIRETVLRRPPPVPVRELRGPELLRALAQEIERDLQDENAGDVRPGCFASTVLTGDRECRWPESTPCLAYGVEGCGMKAQELRP